MTALVFGASASGKSGYGEDLLCALPRRGELLYLATMEPFGPAAQGRIRRHQALREGKGFSTLERSRDLEGALIPEGAAVLLEDLDNLAANELFSSEELNVEGAFCRIQAGLEAVDRTAEHLVVVSGDLFRDGAAYPRETQLYLDLLSRLQRDLAARADQVVEVVCSLPVFWKGANV